MSGEDGRSPLDHALHDGEDYELLLSAPAPARAAIEAAGGAWVGTVDAQRGVRLAGDDGEVPLDARGWNPSGGATP